MYWEEAIELIKTHQSNPGHTYDYHKGTLKSGYIDIKSFPLSLKKGIEKYLKYDLTDLQIFSSLGASEGFGVHDDPDDVLIICLEGEISYVVEKYHGFTAQEDAYIKNDPVILKPGDTIFIQKGLKHMGISSTVPRICLSCGGARNVPKEEVTHYFGSRYRTKI